MAQEPYQISQPKPKSDIDQLQHASKSTDNDKNNVDIQTETTQATKIDHNENNLIKNVNKEEKKSDDYEKLHSIIIKHAEFESWDPIDLNAILKPLSSAQETVKIFKKFISKRHITHDKQTDVITLNDEMFEYKYKLTMLLKSNNKSDIQTSWVYCGCFIHVYIEFVVVQ